MYETYKVIYYFSPGSDRGRHDGHYHVVFVQALTEADAYTQARKEIGNDIVVRSAEKVK